MPSLCSSSGDVPKAFAMTAPRPKNIRAELGSPIRFQCRQVMLSTYSFHNFRTVFKCVFLMFPTSRSQQYCHLSALFFTCQVSCKKVLYEYKCDGYLPLLGEHFCVLASSSRLLLKKLCNSTVVSHVLAKRDKVIHRLLSVLTWA